MLAADNEHGAEVYSAATTRDQARIVFDDARAMAERTPDLRSCLGVAIMQHSLTVAATSSKAAPLAAEGSTLDGLNVHCAIIDELHAHKTRAVYDVIDTARGAREQSLLWLITTAGTDKSGICYERRTHVTKVLEHVVTDPALFGIIYTLDDNDDPFAPASWAKANPNYGRSVLPMTCRPPPAKPRPCHRPCPTSSPNASTFGSAANPLDGHARLGPLRPPQRINLPDHAGAKAWLGLDLAQKKTLPHSASSGSTATSGTCARLYLNELAIQESGNAHLSGWARQGYVQVTDGDITDFDVVAEDLRSICRTLDVQEIAFDPALSMYFAGKLLEEGLPWSKSHSARCSSPAAHPGRKPGAGAKTASRRQPGHDLDGQQPGCQSQQIQRTALPNEGAPRKLRSTAPSPCSWPWGVRWPPPATNGHFGKRNHKRERPPTHQRRRVWAQVLQRGGPGPCCRPYGRACGCRRARWPRANLANCRRVRLLACAGRRRGTSPIQGHAQNRAQHRARHGSPTYDLLANQPNEWMTSFELRELLVWHAALCGAAYCYQVRDTQGRLLELLPLPPAPCNPNRPQTTI